MGKTEDKPKLKAADEVLRDPSDHFDKAISDVTLWGGTPVALCRCGRYNFATGDRGLYSDDPQELTRLYASQKADPERYIEHGDADTVGVVDLPAMGTMVWGCPCNGLYHLENALWDLRELALAYFGRRTEAEIQTHSEALQQAKAARKRLKQTRP
jgi:hypothetical protein